MHIPNTILLGEIAPLRWIESPLFRLGDVTITVLGIAKGMFWLVAVFIANSLIRRFVIQRILERTHLDAGLRFAITRIFGYLFVILGFYIALTTSGVNLNSLAVAAGALGIGVGLGLQNLVSNFVSGLVLLAERPISIGDRIELGGLAGNVTKINLRSTIVLTNDNISIIVPNSELTSHPITNWNHGDSKVRVRIPVGVAYGTDVEMLRMALLQVADATSHVLKAPEPAVYLIEFGENSINFELAVWTQELANAPRRFRSELNFAVERKFRELGIEIPFPQRVVHIKSSPRELPMSIQASACPPLNPPS